MIILPELLRVTIFNNIEWWLRYTLGDIEHFVGGSLH